MQATRRTTYKNTILYYDIENSFPDDIKVVKIGGGAGIGSLLEIPSSIDDMDVVAIDKKAFLGENSLKEIIVPETVFVIDDWAFAQCANLEKIVIKNEKASFGKGIFDDCTKIKNICIGYEKEDCKSAILGTLPHKLQADYIFENEDISGSDWYTKWDLRLSAYLDEPDMEGYTTLVLCGEEDILHSEVGYVSEKIKNKVELCLVRLLNDDKLDEALRKKFTRYVLKYIKGKSSEEAWQVMLERFSDDMSYFEKYTEIGAVTKDNIDDMLLDMGNDHAEAKAYLMKYKKTNFDSKNIFDDFVL